MRSVWKVLIALALTALLAVGAWAEEADTAAVETPASGVTVTVSEKEFEAGDYSIYILTPYDKRDTVLTDPAKRTQVKIALALIANTLRDTDSVVYLSRTSAAEGEEIQIDLNGTPAQWDKDVDSLMEAEQTDNRLDSRMIGIVPRLLETADENTVLLILSDGILDAASPYAQNNISAKLEETGAHVIYRAMDIVDANRAEVTEECVRAFVGEAADYQEIETENAGIQAAEDVFAALDKDVDFVALGSDQQTSADALERAAMILADGSIGSAVPTGETAQMVGRIREFDVTIDVTGDVFQMGTPVSVAVNNPYGALNMTYLLDGSPVVPDAEGMLPDMTEGHHSIRATAVNEDMGIDLSTQTGRFAVVAAPVVKEGALTEYTLYAAPDANGVFVCDELTIGSLFEGEVEFSVESGSEEFTAGVNENGAVVLSGTPAAGKTSVGLTVTATDAHGFTGSASVTVELISFPEVLKATGVEPEAPLAGEYLSGDPISAVFRVADEAAYALIGECVQAGWDVQAVYRIDGGEAAVMEGNPEEGWQLNVPAAEGLTSVEVFLTTDGVLTEESVPAWSKEGLIVYTEDQLVASRLDGIVLTADLEDSYAINDVVTVGIGMKDGADELTGAHDYADYQFELIVEGEGIEQGEAGYELHGVPFGVTGSPESGWTVEMPAHVTTTVTAAIRAVKGEETVDGQAVSIDVHVADAQILRKIACMIDGKEVWQEPDMMKLYLVAGGAAALLVILVVVCISLTRKKFKGYLVMEVTVVGSRTYNSKPIDLSVWEKKAVSFGTLLSGSGLPPIAELTSPDLMNKLLFKPAKNAVRVINKSGVLNGEKSPLLSNNGSIQFSTVDNGMQIQLTYRVGAADDGENMVKY